MTSVASRPRCAESERAYGCRRRRRSSSSSRISSPRSSIASPGERQRRLVRNFTLRGWIERPDEQAVDGLLDVRLLTRSEMQSLFPDCVLLEESFLGMTKAYIAVRRHAS